MAMWSGAAAVRTVEAASLVRKPGVPEAEEFARERSARPHRLGEHGLLDDATDPLVTAVPASFLGRVARLGVWMLVYADLKVGGCRRRAGSRGFGVARGKRGFRGAADRRVRAGHV